MLIQQGDILGFVEGRNDDAQVRDMVLATGMTDGMEMSYQRLEAELNALS